MVSAYITPIWILFRVCAMLLVHIRFHWWFPSATCRNKPRRTEHKIRNKGFGLKKEDSKQGIRERRFEIGNSKEKIRNRNRKPTIIEIS